jgi:hypothetical protein
MSEVERAISSLGLESQVHRLSKKEESSLRSQLLSAFVQDQSRRFWWEAFSQPSAEIHIPDGTGFTRLTEFTPEPDEPCWLMVEDFESNEFPIYEATPQLAVRLIGECHGFEYYLIAKDRRWLICENHHNVVIGVGSEVVAAINQAAA